MLQKIVEKIINKIIGQYVQQFSSDNLHIGIWQGHVIIKNVKLKKDIIKKLNLPFNIKYSRLGCLKMNIPWSSLGSSKIQVSVQGLELLITEVPQQFWQLKNHKIIEHRKKQIQNYCDTIINDFAKKSNKSNKNAQDKEQGYFSAMVMKIIDNIQVIVKDIHIRFEDQITKKFSFGTTLEELKIYTVNKHDQAEFIDRTKKNYENQPLRKKLLLSNLGVYWNESSQFFGAEPHDEMVESISRKDGANKIRMNYLLLMTFNAMLFQREPGKQFEEPQINLLIDFNQLRIQISNQQLQQIVTLAERFQRFSVQIKAQNRKKLTQLEMIANRQVFLQLFPKYFQNKCTPDQMKKINDILEKMQTQNFEQGIKQHLQSKQKQKMIQERIQKSKGWFTGPKELTEQEMREIEKFINENFGTQTKIVKRPENFYYIRVNFNLKLLQIIVSINNLDNKIKQGIRVRFNEIKMEFNLRQQGYMLNFAMNNIKIDIFKKYLLRNAPEEVANIVQTISAQQKIGITNQYVRLSVYGNPLHKKYLDTEVILKTEELLIVFHPRIIKIALEFANIKLNTQNSQAALEAYGELKNKAATAANHSIKKPFHKKNFISLDVSISAINLLLLFDPLKPDSDIWAIKLGETKIYSDPEILKQTQFNYDQPMEKYGLSFAKISFMHFINRNAYFFNRTNNIQVDNKEKIFSDLRIDFEIELYKNSTQNIPKIKLKTVLHKIDIYLSSFIYDVIQKIGDSFTLKNDGTQVSEYKEKQKLELKSEVMKEANKIGVLYEQSKQPKKFIAVLNGHYLYLYKDKKDVEYSEYYYLKNCQMTFNNETQPNKKMYEVVLTNSVNTLKLGFDKAQLMEEWVKAIKSIDAEKEEYKQYIEEKQKEDKIKKKQSLQVFHPDQLNLEICAVVQSVGITTLFEKDKQIFIGIKDLDSKIKIHQAKNVLDFSLHSVQIHDNIYIYKYKELEKLLYSTAIAGKEKLIQISILNYLPTHPQYDLIDALINVELGKIICNYKPETVQRLMNFYVPKDSELAKKRKEKGGQLTKQEKQALEKQKKKRREDLIQKEIKSGKPETFLIQLNLKIQQISATLVNRKNRVMFSKFGLTGFDFKFGLSSRRMLLKGSLKQIWFADFSNYPYTIYLQQAEYSKVNYIVQSYGGTRKMLKFDIELLQLPNAEGKTILVKTYLYDIKASYIQQPVLRCINYLLEQVLPSLTPPEDLSKPKQLPKNDVKPQLSTIYLVVKIENILAIVQPRCGENQFLQLNVSKLQVRNKSYFRDFIKNRKQQQENVLVQNYYIKMQGIKIMEKFKGSLIKLTNDLNFDVSCDLIQNSPYYRKIFGDRFEAGMRIYCELTPFLMCINHDDYNFIMKCLYWNIIYDDNAEGYFSYPMAQSSRSTIQASYIPPQQNDPIHFGLSMSKIILCVTENGFPLSILLLNQMKYDLTLDDDGMYMVFKMKHLYGTTISKTEDPNVSIERGMFNSFGYEKKHATNALYNMQNLVNAFSRNQLIYKDTNEHVVYFKMITKKMTGESTINLKIKDIKIAIQLKTLLILSKLALLQDSIQPPKSTIIPKGTKPETKNSGMVINIEMNNFLGCLGDKSFVNYIVMQGAFYLKLKLNPTATEQQVLQQSKISQLNGRFRDQSSYQVQIKNYSLYFCNVNDLKNKRFILMPLNIFLLYRQFYGKIHDTPFLQNQIDGMMDRTIIECSVIDILMINKILQDNLQTLSEVSNPPIQTSAKKINQSLILESEWNFKEERQQAVDAKALKKSVKEPEKKIKNKTKGTIKLQPVQLKVVNDCGHNFMPVLNFIIQESTLIYSSDAIQTRFGHSLIMKLDFFNPRSASWEPIMQTFQISLDFLTKNTQNGQKSKILITSSQIEELKQLKFNISTQLITTILATLQIAKQEKKQLNQNKQKEEVQISPYIIENKSNHTITIHREIDHKLSDIDIKPLFKGPLRMTDRGQTLNFTYKGKQYSISMEKFGTCIIPKVKEMHLEFRIDQLNRIISFVDRFVIKNFTNLKLFCVRFNEKRNKLEDYIEMDSQQVIPVKGEWFVQFSFNLKTFTPPTKVFSLSKLFELKAQSEKFKLSINEKLTVLEHSIIYIRAPFLICNCLPKDIKFQFISNGKHVSTKQIQAQSTHEVFANEDFFSLKFKIITEGFYWSEQFWIDSMKFGQEQLLSMKDREEGSIFIKYVFQKDEKKCQYKFSVFCPAFILSQLEEDVHIYGNRQIDQKNKSIEKYYLLGGQSQFWKRTQQNKMEEEKRTIDKVTLVGAHVGSKLRICGSNCIIDFSQPFSINSIGVHQARVVVERVLAGRKMGVFVMLALEIQLKKMTKNSNIFSKQITIRYRYIVSNATKHELFIRQEGSQKQCFYIGKGQKKPFYYTVPSLGMQSRKMIIRTADSLESFPMISNTIGVIYFRLEQSKKKGEYIYLKMNTLQIKSYIFYQFSEINYEDLPYQVVVKSEKFKLFVPHFEKVLTKTSEPLLFINELPQQSFNLFMLISLQQTEQSFEITVETDDLNFKKMIKFLNKQTNTYTSCLVQVIANDNKKFIIIDEATSLYEDQKQYEMQIIHINLFKLSISFIQNHASVQKPYEAFYFYMQNLELAMLKTNLFTRYQVRLQYLQFDQDEPFNIPDPVIITPYKFKQFISIDPKDKPKSIFNILLVIDNSFMKNIFVNLVAIEINDLVIRANTYFIKLVMSMVKEYNDVFKNESQFLIKRQTNTWKQIIIPPQGRKTFIKCLQMAPFTVQITAQLRLNELDIESVLFFGTIINALGVVITNIQGAPIKFDGIVLANCVDTINGIQQKLIEHYKGSVVRQLYKIFGSLNIIGNPVSLFRNISTGIKALKDKPAEGFLQGPLQFGWGIAGGTSSLIAHSIGGVLGSLQKVTGTFASGLAVLTFDKEFEEARQKQKMKKPKHIFEGLEKGGKAVFHGFKEGITGVFTKPIEHTKKQGAIGFIKGTAQGMAGLVVKPVTGVVDFASKTTQGLKNTALYLEDKPNQNRIRYPRVFYTECSVIRQYNPIDSKLFSIINKTKYEDRYGFENTMFMNSFMINQQQFLLVLLQDLIMVRMDNEKIEWAVPLENLIIVREAQDKIRVAATSRRQWYTKKVNEVINFKDKEEIMTFIKLIEELKVNLKDKINNKELDPE